MSENLIMWLEAAFNIVYLLVVWFMVFLMIRNMKRVKAEDRQTASVIQLAFILLAAGDTGHVGFRVVATMLGDITYKINLLGQPMSLVGLGMMTTAFTVTLFYMVFVFVWQARFKKPSNWLTVLLLAAGVFRLAFMALPMNDWGSPVPPDPMSIYRNIPLMIQGVGLLVLILIQAGKQKDNLFKWIGWMIAISFAFYTPVILWAQQLPLLGMLMIPKTCAYLAIAWLAYRGIWQKKTSL